MSDLIHEFILQQAMQAPHALALSYQGRQLSYEALAREIESIASAWTGSGLRRIERVAVYAEKREEAVVALFGTAAAGGVFVPINPLLKPEQVAYILQDCNVSILVTTSERLISLADVLPGCRDLRTIVVAGAIHQEAPSFAGMDVVTWDALTAVGRASRHRVIDRDMAAILYTSGSTGKPKGVVLSHRNLVAGAKSVAGYLENTCDDRILAVLPLSFDYGLSQLTTAFYSGATAVLMNYLLPRDVVAAVRDERITGLAAVPPLWIQLARQAWPDNSSLRYITNSGGAMPRTTLDALRAALPTAKVYLMYGLTEAFRSTFLPPSELDRRPDSIGRSIPNAEVMVVRDNGMPCGPNEPGELVHRGALVSLGYWNDPEKTAERFKPVPSVVDGLVIPEIAVWSGDTVSMDEEGFLYFMGRADDMIKVSGYRVSPTEVEDVILATGTVEEVAAIGVPHPTLGQAIVAVVHCSDAAVAPDVLIKACRHRLPGYMVPVRVDVRRESLPRNPNGKIDRKALRAELTVSVDQEFLNE
ncbi:acyl-CoA ligase (AMP-forming), exosortase A system-associated [Noviherbaspirillum cavernae]|uniref:Acyl-CoA ligase (AMP-forming), exosortase A system-associated n=1 Tax=Noviherbaspirillum cavernae TaxID=2320862 RepID=A0A418X3Q6_9BURK|nr:acyl-CoA ligase (AMP-forming), exosortase A system-associated [Noviherbaspirillum cavernae]RJG07055.1 acyl-CoA ligase (AMP-forming), exosortase A system-associated [Noviherbaspirillum cavernae]